MKIVIFLIPESPATALTLIVPHARSGFASGGFDMIKNFAGPLDSRASIRVRVFGNKAEVCPVSIRHFLVLPGGNTIGMVRVDGEWYFTGKVSID